MEISKKAFVLGLTVFLAVTTISQAQHEETPNNDFNLLQEQLKKDYFSLGLLVQGLADYQPKRLAGYNGFSASKARFKIKGLLDNRFGYNVQATMLKNSPILDANLYYNFHSHHSVKVGLFKSPFTQEYLTGASSILFVNRSSVVNQLGTKRQVGVQLDGYTPNRFLRYTAGIFNGSNFGSNYNDDSHFQYIGRLEANLLKDAKDNSAKVGINIAYEQKDNPPAYGNITTTFEGEQTLLGSYFKVSQGKWLIDGEFIYSWLDSQLTQNHNPYGYYTTLGYLVTQNNRVLVRWDNFNGNNLTTDSESLIAGWNYYPSSYTKIKLNYTLPLGHSASYSNFLASMQISF